MKFELPSLSYPYDALEPHMDAATMELHHTKHHAGYVTKLNNALMNYPELSDVSLETLLSSLGQLPAAIRTEVKNNGGGHFNHSFFWRSLAPATETGEPSAELEMALESMFGSFAKFKSMFEEKAKGHFASGWAWLAVDRERRVVVKTLPDHEWPCNFDLEPLMVLDLWEHAYYLKFQNRRADYVASFWKVVNWAEVNRRFSRSRASRHAQASLPLATPLGGSLSY